MDSHRIRLSALGRDVQVGNLYNYYADTISTSKYIHHIYIFNFYILFS